MAVKRWVLFKIVVCCTFLAPSFAQTTDVLSSSPENTPTKYTFRFPLGTPTPQPAPSSIFYSPTVSASLHPAFTTEVPPLNTRTWNLNRTVGFRSGFSTQKFPNLFAVFPHKALHSMFQDATYFYPVSPIDSSNGPYNR